MPTYTVTLSTEIAAAAEIQRQTLFGGTIEEALAVMIARHVAPVVQESTRQTQEKLLAAYAAASDTASKAEIAAAALVVK